MCFSLLRYVSQWHFRACAHSRRSRPEKRRSPRQADARRTMKLRLSQWRVRACAHGRRSPQKNKDPPDADRTREADLIVKTPCKNVFEETRLDPAHGGSAFWHLLPRVLGPTFNSFLKNVAGVLRKLYLLRNISAGRLQVAVVLLFSQN